MASAGHVCATAPNTVFADVEELKAHYKSDWHRYNLKRKVAGLPMVSRELFERVMSHALSAGEAAEQATPSTAHLKADKPRRPARTHRIEHDDDDDDDDDWEEVEGEEAEAVLAQLAQRRGGRPARPPAPARAGDSSGSEDEEMASAKADAGSEGVAISLAGNGVELVVGRHVLGAREFSRYYRQRHRPVDSRALAVASAGGGGSGANAERGIVLSRSGRAPAYRGPAVTKQEARAQRVEQSTAARMRMLTEMSANGPQFRGYRE